MVCGWKRSARIKCQALIAVKASTIKPKSLSKLRLNSMLGGCGDWFSCLRPLEMHRNRADEAMMQGSNFNRFVSLKSRKLQEDNLSTSAFQSNCIITSNWLIKVQPRNRQQFYCFTRYRTRSFTQVRVFLSRWSLRRISSGLVRLVFSRLSKKYFTRLTIRSWARCEICATV